MMGKEGLVRLLLGLVFALFSGSNGWTSWGGRSNPFHVKISLFSWLNSRRTLGAPFTDFDPGKWWIQGKRSHFEVKCYWSPYPPGPVVVDLPPIWKILPSRKTNICLGVRNIIFKMPFLEDMLVPWRVVNLDHETPMIGVNIKIIWNRHHRD